MANKENYSPATVKQANFARNAAKWNEGGAAQPTPIKKEMDIDKMRMAREAFELEQGRMDMQMMQAMALKQDAHDQSMKLKKESATMKTPLSKGE